MDELQHLLQQAERIRASGVMGQSRLLRLFDFLVESSLAGKAPKEAVIAIDVFDKASAIDVTRDAIVRVYIHNLRRKLDQYYAGPGHEELVRLAIPKGDYRLVVTPRTHTPAPSEARPASPPSRSAWTIPGVVACVALVLAAIVGSLYLRRPHLPWAEARGSPVWARLLQNDKPIVVVMGDYYIFGDTERGMETKRLIREFSINSKDDLQEYLMANPKWADRYMDVGLGYLPTSSATALANLMPIIAASERRRVRVVMMSDLDPAILKSSNIVYIGLLSGLRTLQGIVFGSSRFAVGETFDELIDRKTQHRYVSEAVSHDGEPARFGNTPSYLDYGYFSTFSGPAGNQIMIVSGTRDEGLRHTAEALTDATRLNEIDTQVGRTPDFEALFEVWGMDRINLNGKLLTASPLNTASMWSSNH